MPLSQVFLIFWNEEWKGFSVQFDDDELLHIFSMLRHYYLHGLPCSEIYPIVLLTSEGRKN